MHTLVHTATCPLIAGTHLSLLLGHQAFSGDWIWKRRRGGAPAQIIPRWTPYLGPPSVQPLCSRLAGLAPRGGEFARRDESLPRGGQVPSADQHGPS